MQRIISVVEARMQPGEFSMNALKTATQEAIRELELMRAIETRGLRRIADSGVSQSLIASVIFEAVKLLIPA